VKLIKLSLKNFKGTRAFVLDARGGNVTVYGDNATGKTTLFDAFTWLLFDKDSQGRKDFEIKTLDASGQPMHGLEHEVEAVLQVDGKTVTLRKVYKEKWTKKRGSAQAEFTGHTTDYFVDGVPVKKAEYDARIASICDETVFKLLTNPTYFNEQLHWQERRRILLQVCGDISDEEVIASDPALSKLPEVLNGRKLEDHRKVIQARRSEINRELEKIPIRIDEVQRSLPDVSGIDEGKIGNELLHLKTALRQKQEKLARLEAGGEIAEKTKTLREIEAELLRMETEARKQVEERIWQKRAQLRGVEDRIGNFQADIKLKQREMADNQTLIQRTEARMDELRQEWHRVNGQQLDYAPETVCPTCGQPLPDDKVTEAWAKALAAFNRDKAQRLESITVEGQMLKKRVEELRARNAKLATEIEVAEAEVIPKLTEEAARIRVEIDALLAQGVDLSGDIYYLQKKKIAQVLTEEIQALSAGSVDALAALREEIGRIEGEIASLQGGLGAIEARRQGEKRIEELKAEERRLAAEYEKLEQELYLTEQFIRRKVELLEEKINSRFKLARFKLFDVQVNGAVVECCETLYSGVPYSTALNNGARINVGLDIINTLAEHYGFAPPIFVDNAEAVTRLIPTRGQMIKLVVSGADKELRVEYETENVQENLVKEAV
jgi:DNA repair exonuclease SbcCD ATPase subunit